MPSTVAVLLQEPVAAFELGVLCEVFGIDRTDDGVPAFDFRVCAAHPNQPYASSSGIAVIGTHDLAGAREADLVAVAAGPIDGPYDRQVLQALREAHDRGARILSVCSGAFTLAAAGLLEGRHCATHWRYAAHLRDTYPGTTVDLDVLYVDDGQVITSAGTAAGIDACLHVVRQDHGVAVANRIARRMVVPPHRDGGQRQFVETPVPEQACESLQPVLEFVLDNLADEHAVPDLARRAHLSERTFARRFADEVGTTPHRWVTQQRVAQAKHLLESTALDVEQVAHASGFTSAAGMRPHFQREVGVPPLAYRRRFSS